VVVVPLGVRDGWGEWIHSSAVACCRLREREEPTIPWSSCASWSAGLSPRQENQTPTLWQQRGCRWGASPPLPSPPRRVNPERSIRFEAWLVELACYYYCGDERMPRRRISTLGPQRPPCRPRGAVRVLKCMWTKAEMYVDEGSCRPCAPRSGGLRWRGADSA
jgi:hypothetical protein